MTKIFSQSDSIKLPIITHYQPIVSLSSGKPVGYECLSRFIDKNGMGIGPADVEHMFNDRTFLFSMLSKNVTDVIMSGNINLDCTFSINVDPLTIQYDHYRLLTFLETIAERENATNKIKFELTEKHLNCGAASQVLEIAKDIRKLGYKIVLDDFGAGGANIHCLQKFDFDTIKIDGSMICGIEKNQEKKKALRHAIKEIRNIHIGDIVAEHIETEECLEIVNDLDIEHGQGFLFGRPTPRPTIK